MQKFFIILIALSLCSATTAQKIYIPTPTVVQSDTAPRYSDPTPVVWDTSRVKPPELTFWDAINDILGTTPIDSTNDRWIKKVVFFQGVQMQITLTKNDKSDETITIKRWSYAQSKRTDGLTGTRILSFDKFMFSLTPMVDFRAVPLRFQSRKLTMYIPSSKAYRSITGVELHL